MTGTPVPSKQELLDALRASRDEVLATVRALPPARLEEGRYENGWNGRQILAHVASIEWSYPRLIDIALPAGRTGRRPRRPAICPPGRCGAGTIRTMTGRWPSARTCRPPSCSRSSRPIAPRRSRPWRPLTSRCSPAPFARPGASSARSRWSSIRSRCSTSSATSVISRRRVRPSRSFFEDRQGRAQHLRLGVVRAETALEARAAWTQDPEAAPTRRLVVPVAAEHAARTVCQHEAPELR